MTTVLLVNPDYHEDSRSFPIGLGVLTGALARAGHHPALLDIDSRGHGPDAVEAMVRASLAAHAPGLIGIAGMITTYRSVAGLIACFRRHAPAVPIVLGGSLPRTAPAGVLDRLDADHLIIGDGELPLAMLADAVAGRGEWAAIPNLASRRDGAWVANPLPEWRSAVAGEAPIRYDLFDVPSYIQPPKVNYFDVISGRGCVMRCNFCFKMTGSKVRKKEPAEMLDELQLLNQRYGINRFSFADDNFGLSPKWIEEMMVERARRRMDFEWRFQASVNTIRQADFVRRMRDNGLRGVSMGIESGSPEVLKYIGKGLDIGHARDLLGWLREAGLQVDATFILGWPIETERTIEETRAFLRDNHFSTNFQLFLLTPYPGTPLYDEALGRGLIADEEAYVASLIGQRALRINLTGFPDEQLLAWHRDILREFQGDEAVGAAERRQRDQDRLLAAGAAA